MGLMGIGLDSPHIYACYKTNKLIARVFYSPGYIVNMDMTLEHKRSMCRRRGRFKCDEDRFGWVLWGLD